MTMFCAQCGTANDDTARFCKSCGYQLAAAPPAAATSHAPVSYTPPAPPQTMRGPVVAPAPQYATGRNPVVALILSLIIVGVGQFYNGDHKKGALMLILAFIAGIFTLGFGWFAIAIWSAIDAYRVANGSAPIW
jgi:TM2 domain-containing membrane protein YozV